MSTTIYTEPIPMEGYRALEVEVRLLDRYMPADLVVQWTNDATEDGKSWACGGQALDMAPGAHALGEFARSGRFARVRVDIPKEIEMKHIWIRVTRLD